MSIEYKYYDSNEITEKQYFAFIEKAYGDKAKHKCEERFPWLKKNSGYRILLALSDGEIIGQACAYEVKAMANGKEITLTWGIDNVVLPEARGKGVGKTLQKTLHETTQNFSSAWYSYTNGHIKKKCGARAFAPNRFPYYAVSKFLGIYAEIAFKLIFKKTIRIPSRIPNLYHCIFGQKNIKSATITEIKDFTEEQVKFIQEALEKNYDFYVKRDYEYLKWRYNDNPTIKNHHVLEVRKGDGIIAIIGFTEPQYRSYVRTTYYGATILDIFVKDNNVFSKKEALSIVVNYYKEQEITLDGISTIFEIPYLPKINYPKKGIPFLTTYNGEINRPYISLLDQDMEQM